MTDMSWMYHARTRCGKTPDLFAEVRDPLKAQAALQICETCPGQPACQQWWLTQPSNQRAEFVAGGIWWDSRGVQADPSPPSEPSPTPPPPPAPPPNREEQLAARRHTEAARKRDFRAHQRFLRGQPPPTPQLRGPARTEAATVIAVWATRGDPDRVIAGRLGLTVNQVVNVRREAGVRHKMGRPPR